MRQGDQIDLELERIRAQNKDGLLIPADVVEWARRNKRSALHDQFEWDDKAAAYKWRLHRARNIIITRVAVVKSQDDEIRTRAYVSLPSDRMSTGGYRPAVEVMSEDQRRAELLKAAHSELDTFRRKYATLQELDPIFEAIGDLNGAGVFAFDVPAIAA